MTISLSPLARRQPLVSGAATLALAAFLTAQVQEQPTTPASPRMLEAKDYGKWETLGSGGLSPDGQWATFTIRRQNGGNALHLRQLGGESKTEFKFGNGAVFSADNHWLGVRIGVSEAQREKLAKAKKPVRSKLGLRDLIKGKTTTVDDVASFRFSDDGRWLVMRRYPIQGRKSSGVDTVVRDLKTGRDTNFGNVGSFAWCDDSSLLAMTIDAEGKAGNGVQVYDAATGVLKTLDSAAQKYTSLRWRKDAADLAVLRERDRDEAAKEDVSYVVLSWRDLNAAAPRAKVYDQLKDESFPKAHRVVDYAGLRWSKNGRALFFGVAPWTDKPGEAAESQPKVAAKGDAKTLRDSLKKPAGVEIWHAKDIDIQPRQKKTARADLRRHHLTCWWLDRDQVVQLGSELTERVVLARHEAHALGLDNSPYETQKRFGPTLWDAYAIDTRDGSRKKFLAGVKFQLGSSPSGEHFLYVRKGHLWTYDIESGKHRNLTKDLPSRFTDQENSSLTDEKPPYGIAGWTENGKVLFAYDRYDLWMLRADGSSAKRLTDGASTQVKYRRIVMDRENDEFIDLAAPMYLSCYGDLSKKSGFARLRVGGKPQRLMFKDKAVSRLMRAEDRPVFAYVEEGFDDSPDLFVADADLANPRQITKTNPFQKDYHWGRSELVNYVNAHGQQLQGALHYPAGYEAGKKYPMIVYIYELRSQQLHRYSTPSERRPYNPAVFTTQGYFVFQPDIVYRPQNPGLSAVECVVPAVEKVLAGGMVDPRRVGLVGHSWGAYQTAFIVTQTDLFAAGVAGAPLTNMMSMSMSIYWNSGQTDAWIFHESQGRMDRPFWRDVDTYIKNSPIFSIDKLNTPLLVAFGDKDGAVDWHQGIEMYNAARLAQKPLVLLVYAGENHGLRQKPNQVDYHHRVLAWFDTHLKDAEAPKWITQGKTHLEREKELRERARATIKVGSKAKPKGKAKRSF